MTKYCEVILMEIWNTEEWKSKAKNEKISEAQRDFITSLLKNIDFEYVTKLDASNLITILQRCQNSFAPCGKHKEMDLGRDVLDWCLHNCDTDVYDCDFWKNK